MEIEKKIIVVGLFFLVVLSFVSFAGAFGIAVSYWDPDNPLRLEPGDSATITFRLQNEVGDEDITLRAELVEGAEIASIIDESKTYFVPLGSRDVRTSILVDVPEDTPLGSEYKISVAYTQLVGDEGGMVQVASKIIQNIPVVVGEKTVLAEEPKASPAEEGISSTSVMIIIGILVIILILYLLLRKKKRTSR